MSSAPSGWQNPDTNWNSARVPLSPDFIRIEGNIQAIESGSRTLDPSQAPSGNTGTLRQILSWFANRIRAITGGINWWDAPAITLAAAKQHINSVNVHSATATPTANRIAMYDAAKRLSSGAAPFADNDVVRKVDLDNEVDAVLNEVDAVSSALNTHMGAYSGIHGAISSAAANRLVIRDSAGRAQFATPSAEGDAVNKRYVDGLIGSLQAGPEFAYYLTPPDVVLDSNNINYDYWWVQDVNRNVVVRILLPGTIRYHIQYRAGGVTCYVRLLRNGSQIREVETGSTSWQTVIDDITVSPGDIITIQKRASIETGFAYWRNVRIETHQPPLGIQRF